ncbi:MAG: hypothetical protein NC223_06435 [Butyrivibrio sp.]|nr:hypothetical protein [Butyrivibrio sp.]
MDDNLNKEIFGKEKETDLKDMCYYICKKWRGILIGAVIAAVLLTVYKIPSIIELKAILNIIQKIAKYIIIGLVVGVVFMCITYIVSYIASGKVKSENEFKANCRLNIIGVLPKKIGKKLNGIDKLVRRMFGTDRRINDFEELAERLAEDMKAVISVKSAGKVYAESVPCIAVVSTESDETATEVVNLIGSEINSEANIIVAGNILKNAESVRIVMKSDMVLAAERIGASRYRSIEEEYRKLDVWEKTLVGIVFLDGDAR